MRQVAEGSVVCLFATAQQILLSRIHGEVNWPNTEVFALVATIAKGLFLAQATSTPGIFLASFELHKRWNALVDHSFLHWTLR